MLLVIRVQLVHKEILVRRVQVLLEIMMSALRTSRTTQLLRLSPLSTNGQSLRVVLRQELASTFRSIQPQTHSNPLERVVGFMLLRPSTFGLNPPMMSVASILDATGISAAV